MPAAIADQGKIDIRTSLKTLVTHVAVTTDNTAFAANQTACNPSNAGTNLIKAATKTDVAASFAFDASITIDGTTEFTGLSINCISLMKGATRTDMLSRSVRTAGIGVQAGDTFTIGPRVAISDVS